jgi:hypothetical protein
MSWTLKLNVDVDILVFFSLVTVLATFQKFWQFFPNLLVTLVATSRQNVG